MTRTDALCSDEGGRGLLQASMRAAAEFGILNDIHGLGRDAAYNCGPLSSVSIFAINFVSGSELILLGP